MKIKNRNKKGNQWGTGDSTPREDDKKYSQASWQNLLSNVTIPSPAWRHIAVGQDLGARAGAWTVGGVARRLFAAARRVAAWPALASAAATGAGAPIAGAARTIRFHANVGRLSLNTNTDITEESPKVVIHLKLFFQRCRITWHTNEQRRLLLLLTVQSLSLFQ